MSGLSSRAAFSICSTAAATFCSSPLNSFVGVAGRAAAAGNGKGEHAEEGGFSRPGAYLD